MADDTRRARLARQRRGPRTDNRHPDHELSQVSAAIRDELEEDGTAVARQILGKVQPDSEHVGTERYLEMVRRGYEHNDRKWLEDLADQNPVAFEKAANSLGVRLPEELDEEDADDAPVPTPDAPAPTDMVPQVGGAEPMPVMGAGPEQGPILG